eukprot:4498430-Pleurochrysis_carterae.AAC.1
MDGCMRTTNGWMHSHHEWMDACAPRTDGCMRTSNGWMHAHHKWMDACAQTEQEKAQVRSQKGWECAGSGR